MKKTIEYIDSVEVINNINSEEINEIINKEANILVTDVNGVILYINNKCSEMLKYKSEELIGKQIRILNSNYHPKLFFKDLWDTVLAGNRWEGEVNVKLKTGEKIWHLVVIYPILDGNGKPKQFLTIRTDITEKKENEERIKKSKKLYNSLIENSSDVIGIFNEKNEITFLNSACEKVLGYENTETLGKSIFKYMEFSEKKKLEEILNGFFEKYDETLQMEMELKHKNGSSVWCEVNLTNYLNEPSVNGIVFNYRDITQQKEINDKIKKMAYYDYLTELPNRRNFEEEIKKIIERSKKETSSFALMLLDLDGFKHINDSLGARCW